MGLGIIMVLVPPGEGVLVAGCRCEHTPPSALRHTDCFLQLRALGCLQDNVALATSNYTRVHFPLGEAELCSLRRHQFHCRN